MEIRRARSGDLGGIVNIYNHYVLNSVATFDESPVTAEDRAEWFAMFKPTGPHRLLVADDGAVRGYAASTPYRDHPAFSATVEFSVYVSPTHTGRGLGVRLYERLLDELESESIHRVVVGIALPNDASIRLHGRFGFEEIGVFDEYAEKWGERVSSTWMQLRR